MPSKRTKKREPTQGMSPKKGGVVRNARQHYHKGPTFINKILLGAHGAQKASHGSAPPATKRTLHTRVEWLGHLTDAQRRDAITVCLKKMLKDRAAMDITIALDFCSFGAFGNFAKFKQQAKLINDI